MNADVLVLQHVAPEHPGILAEVLTANGLQLRIVRTWEGDRVPTDPAPYAAIVVMGGPMGVYETERHPHLRDEIALLRACLERGTPALGVCLGAELLAVAAGGRVFPSGTTEIGWFTLRRGRGADADPLGRLLPVAFPVFEWHGDYYELPPDAIVLAGSERFPAQVFRVGDRAYGLLCHLEITAQMVAEWIEAFAGEVPDADARLIREGSGARAAELGSFAPAFFRAFAEMVTGIAPDSAAPIRRSS